MGFQLPVAAAVMPWQVSQTQPYPAHCRNTLFLPWVFHLFAFNIVLQCAHHSIAGTKRATM